MRLFTIIVLQLFFVIAAQAASVTTDSGHYAPGSTAVVTVSGGPGTPGDWVGLYAVGAPNTDYLDWRYLNGQHAQPSQGQSSATISLGIPQAEGQYVVRLLFNNGYDLIISSLSFEVSSGTDVQEQDLSWIISGADNIRAGNFINLMDGAGRLGRDLAPFTRTEVGSANPVVGAFCPIGATGVGPTAAVSVGCQCRGNGSSQNFGVLSICQTTSTGAVAACFYETSSYDPALRPPSVELNLICFGEPSATHDSSRAVPVQFRQDPLNPNPEVNTLPSQRKTSTVQSATTKLDYAELDAALNKAWDAWSQHAHALLLRSAPAHDQKR